MKLIADCGSTKIDWCVTRQGEEIKRFGTRGMNAVMLSAEQIDAQIAAEVAAEVDGMHFSSVHFYGAGCISDDVCKNVSDAIGRHISADCVEVHTDLLAAARALCGHSPGIACILGTGSNSCYYDGEAIADNVSPLGFILGDEGSGAVLGKLLLGDVLKRQLPADVCEKFYAQYGVDRVTVIKHVYRESQPNRYLASFAPFLAQNLAEPAVHDLVLRAFKSFIKRNVAQYPDYQSMHINFVGSIAQHFGEVLAEAADACGCTIGVILKSPMPGLIKFHA